MGNTTQTLRINCGLFLPNSRITQRCVWPQCGLRGPSHTYRREPSPLQSSHTGTYHTISFFVFNDDGMVPLRIWKPQLWTTYSLRTPRASTTSATFTYLWCLCNMKNNSAQSLFSNNARAKTYGNVTWELSHNWKLVFAFWKVARCWCPADFNLSVNDKMQHTHKREPNKLRTQSNYAPINSEHAQLSTQRGNTTCLVCFQRINRVRELRERKQRWINGNWDDTRYTSNNLWERKVDKQHKYLNWFWVLKIRSRKKLFSAMLTTWISMNRERRTHLFGTCYQCTKSQCQCTW